jgi:hypothetical protein
MSVQIRIAGDKKKPQSNSSHRDFNDFEKTLNKLGTMQEFLDYMIPHLDPMTLKALPQRYFKDAVAFGKVNPFYYMPEHKLKNFVKYMEKTEQWQQDEIEPVMNVARWAYSVFKDVTHLTTSECLALAMESQERISNSNPKLKEWLENDNLQSEKNANEVAEIIHSVLSDFQQHWELYMNKFNDSVFKRHAKSESD